jgi:outer membrane murein-binding lipoprotein Lpp
MRAALTIASVALVSLLLSGCVPPQPVETPSPEASVTPIFATDEEALAAATAAYAAYVKLADQIFVEGGKDPERLDSVATGGFLKASVEGFRDVQEKGWVSTGGTVFRGATLQSYSATGPTEVVTIYICEDISVVDVFDSSNVSIVSPDRPDSTTFQATFDLDGEGPGLLLSSREVWSNDPC